MDIYLESLEREREEEQKVQEVQIEQTSCQRVSRRTIVAGGVRVICAPIMQSKNVNCS